MTFRSFSSFRSFQRRALASFLVAAAALAVRAAHADAPPPDISAAKQAFESAVTLEGEQRWAEAALKLRQAIAVKDTPGLRFHLAHCELEQGHLVEASLEYDRVSELLRQGAKAPDVQKLLGPARDALKGRIPRLTVELPPDLGAPATAVDGKPYPPSELALGVPLNPGRHLLRITAPGRRPFEQVLQLSEAQAETVRPRLSVAPPPVTPAASAVPAPASSMSSPAPGAPPAPASDKQSSSAKVYFLIGESVLTLAGLGVGIGGQLSASSASDRVVSAQRRIDDVAAGDGSACNRAELIGACRDLQGAINDHDNATTLSEVGFISAGVGAVALVTTWLAYPDSPSSASSVRVQPVAGLGRIGLIGSF
ncbi:MAG: hypothetical protein ABUL62_11030 [Myxococcales bacterium]